MSIGKISGLVKRKKMVAAASMLQFLWLHATRHCNANAFHRRPYYYYGVTVFRKFQTKRFILDEMRPAFKADELTTSRPIVQEVNADANIQQMFDTISYNKVSIGDETLIAIL